MQGLHLSSHRPPLNELLTLVVISHNRPAFLRRALRYYQTLPCRILVLDSSAEETTDLPTQTVANIDYQHLPQFGYWGMQTKLVYGVPLVTTPYMLFVADDDFTSRWKSLITCWCCPGTLSMKSPGSSRA